MSRFVFPTDFESGEFKISQTTENTIDLQAVIDRVEVELLQDLMGKALYDLFIADLDSSPEPPAPDVPQAARFLAIYDPFYEDETITLRSEGMIAMIRMVVWFEFVQFQSRENTPVGNVEKEFSNSIPLGNVGAGIEDTYNRGILTFHNILQKILLDRTTYPEYNGKGRVREFASWF